MSYRQQPAGPETREVLFADLPPETQGALWQACEGRGVFLVALHAPSVTPWLLGFLWLMSLAVLGVVLSGSDVSGPLSHRTFWFTGVIGSMAAALWLGRAWQRARRPGLPFATGVYLFPRDLVDARSGVLRVHDTAGLTFAMGGGARPALVATLPSGEVFSFPGRFADAADASEQFKQEQRRLDEAVTRDDLATRWSLDPFQAGREHWPRAPGRSPGLLPPAAALGACVALACAAAAPLALVLDEVCLLQARKEKNIYKLASYARSGAPVAARADEAWLDVALARRWLGELVLYSAAGRQKDRARVAIEARDGGRCQSDACWSALVQVCADEGALDLVLLERALPLRGSVARGYGQAFAPEGSLFNLFSRCPGAVPTSALARLDIKNAAMSPTLPRVLWYLTEGQAPEIRREARAALDRLYDEALDELRRRPNHPWVEAQKAMLSYLKEHDKKVTLVAFTRGATPEDRHGFFALARWVSDEVAPRARESASPLLEISAGAAASDPVRVRLELRWGPDPRDHHRLEVTDFSWVVTLDDRTPPLRFEGALSSPVSVPTSSVKDASILELARRVFGAELRHGPRRLVAAPVRPVARQFRPLPGVVSGPGPRAETARCGPISRWRSRTRQSAWCKRRS